MGRLPNATSTVGFPRGSHESPNSRSNRSNGAYAVPRRYTLFFTLFFTFLFTLFFTLFFTALENREEQREERSEEEREEKREESV
jgi:hypothetical protein